MLPLLRSAYHFLLAFFGAFRYGFPSRHLTVIGVTGTNGKTTVVHLLHEMFRAAGYRVGSISSLRFKVNEEEELNLLKMTMPGRGEIQRFLARCRKAGCRYAVIEVTSEGVKQFRHRFIDFHGAVLTNIRPEHLEAHGGFEAYREAKLELFRLLPPDGFAVLNRENPSADVFAAATRAQIAWYSRSAVEVKRVGLPVRVLRVRSDLAEFEIEGTAISSRLGGEFGIMNALAALTAAFASGVSLTAVVQALGRFPGVPGRLEYVQREPFAVVVDYAHTPDALEGVYQTLQGAGGRGQGAGLICVLGSAGGGRDKWKRPEHGKIVAKYCKRIILTSEDSDDEDPTAIIEEIAAGISNFQFPISKIIDRREAIHEALREAKPGDTVIITGMGAQPWFIDKGKKIPWDEREVVREELAKLKG